MQALDSDFSPTYAPLRKSVIIRIKCEEWPMKMMTGHLLPSYAEAMKTMSLAPRLAKRLLFLSGKLLTFDEPLTEERQVDTTVVFRPAVFNLSSEDHQ